MPAPPEYSFDEITFNLTAKLAGGVAKEQRCTAKEWNNGWGISGNTYELGYGSGPWGLIPCGNVGSPVAAISDVLETAYSVDVLLSQ